MAGYQFFSGMLGNTGSSGMGLWNMYNSLGDYSSIKSGSYHKLLSAYYKETKGEDTAKQSSIKNTIKNNGVDSATKQEMNTIKKTTDELQKSAAVLLEKGNKSVYEDEDNLLSAVKDFVSDYNQVLSKAGDSNSEKVLSKTLSMVNNTKAYSKSLEEIGITIGEDNQLSLDADKFKKAEAYTVKSMLQSGSSFAGQTMQKAVQIGAAAQNVSTGTNLYNQNGCFSYQNINSFFDSYL